MIVSARNALVREADYHLSSLGIRILNAATRRYGITLRANAISTEDRAITLFLTPEECAELKRKIAQLEQWNHGNFIDMKDLPL